MAAGVAGSSSATRHCTPGKALRRIDAAAASGEQQAHVGVFRHCLQARRGLRDIHRHEGGAGLQHGELRHDHRAAAAERDADVAGALRPGGAHRARPGVGQRIPARQSRCCRDRRSPRARPASPATRALNRCTRLPAIETTGPTWPACCLPRASPPVQVSADSSDCGLSSSGDDELVPQRHQGLRW